ncbi:MAG: 50S ribosomal protein L9 [Clostridiales bacterium]|nr:50S ribosomal protein L9 [Clostridiales bacterium]
MKVILTQDIRGKGKRGQMIEVSDGYARNYLLPKKLAQEANADNVNTMKMNDKATAERQAKERAEAMDISKKMKDFTVTVTAKGGGAGRLFGSVTNTEIAEALEQQQKIKLDKRKIVLDEPIKTTGLYTVKCKLGYEITGDLKVEVKEA